MGFAASAALAQSGTSSASSASADAPQLLPEVVISASGFEQAVEDAPASITVIPAAELEKKAYTDVTDALRDVPGVVVTGGGSSSDISIRGMAASYTMILVDGKRQNSREVRPNSDGPGIEQGWLPPIEAIERIEIVRGPMSSLYGSDAMGGVINIITKRVASRWSGNVRAEATLQESSDSGNIYQGNFQLSGPLVQNLLGLQLYGHVNRRNEDKFSGGFNEQRARSATAKLSFTPNKDHDLFLELSSVRQERNATAGKTGTSSSSTKYDKDSFSLTHTGRWGIGTSQTYVQRDENDNPGRNMNIKNTAFNTSLVFPFWSGNVATVGLAYQNEELHDLSNQLTSLSTLERYQWALYAESEWGLTDAFALTTGLRMTRDENYGTHWTPRIYGVWKATENLSVKGGVSTGFKTPSLRAAVADWGAITGGGGDPAMIRGNPNLKPEKSISQEIGVIWDSRQGLDASLTLFNTTFKDKITEIRSCVDSGSGGSAIVAGNCTTHGSAFKFISDRENVDEAIMRGLEATLTWHLTPQWRLASNYTYTFSEQKTGTFKGQALNKMPKHMFNANVDWTPSKALGVWGRVSYKGKTSEYLSRTSMAQGTGAFTFVDAGVNYHFTDAVSVGFAVYNLFDKEVLNSTYGATYDKRRYWLSVSAKF
jgi:outer membrane receptor for ferrienterochelin and colicins